MYKPPGCCSSGAKLYCSSTTYFLFLLHTSYSTSPPHPPTPQGEKGIMTMGGGRGGGPGTWNMVTSQLIVVI